MTESIDKQALISLYPHILHILRVAGQNIEKFKLLSQMNATIHPDISYRSLCIYLLSAKSYVTLRTNHAGNYENIIEHLQTNDGIKQALNLIKLFQIVKKREENPKHPLLGIYPNITTIYETKEAPQEKRKVRGKKKSVELNGVSAMDITVRKHTNLQEPILDLQVILNNPIGRLWLAIKRIWKNQNTIITLRFSIPLLVLPICMFILWTIWQGKSVLVPVIKIGTIKSYKEEENSKHMIILSNNEVYFLNFSDIDVHVPSEHTVFVSGTFNTSTQTIYVENIGSFEATNSTIIQKKKTINKSFIQEILEYLQKFY